MELLHSFDIEELSVRLYQGHLHWAMAEGIVLPANPILSHFEGIAEKIAIYAGYKLRAECQKRFRQPIPFGDTVVTHAHQLPYKCILHVVLPKFIRDCERNGIVAKKILTSAVTNMFLLADELYLTSIAVPLLGTDKHGMPANLCGRSYVEALENFVQKSRKNRNLKAVDFFCISPYLLKQIEQAFLQSWKSILVRSQPTETVDNFVISPSRGTSSTSSAVIIVVSTSKFNDIRRRVSKFDTNEYKLRSETAHTVHLMDLQCRATRQVKDVVYIRTPPNLQKMDVFKKAICAELKVLLGRGRMEISFVVDKDAAFKLSTGAELLNSTNVGILLTDCMQSVMS